MKKSAPPDGITVSQLKYVIAVAEFGCFVNAAKSLGVSQPTVSLGVRKFEKIIGISIFESIRAGSKHSVRVSDTGWRIIEKCKLALDGMEKIFAIAGKENPDNSWCFRFKTGIKQNGINHDHIFIRQSMKERGKS